MGMGTRKQRAKQEEIWIAHTELASAPGHPFYQKLNELLAERGIAWRLADSLALRRFVGIALDEYTPDHSTISRTRRLIDVDHASRSVRLGAGRAGRSRAAERPADRD